MNSMHLIGAEDVRVAGNRMTEAASYMQLAASSISHAFEAHERFLTNWLAELDGVLKDRTSDLGVTLGPLG
jgi:hypothetical protein